MYAIRSYYELEREIPPPTIIKIPVTISIIPNPLKGGFLEMKNAINDKIIGGNPNPIPLVMASNGKNPSPAPPPPTRITSYNVCYTKLLRLNFIH